MHGKILMIVAQGYYMLYFWVNVLLVDVGWNWWSGTAPTLSINGYDFVFQLVNSQWCIRHCVLDNLSYCTFLGLSSKTIKAHQYQTILICSEACYSWVWMPPDGLHSSFVLVSSHLSVVACGLNGISCLKDTRIRRYCKIDTR